MVLNHSICRVAKANTKKQTRHGMQVETYFALAKAWAAKTTRLKAFESRLNIERMIGHFFVGQWQR